MTLPDRSLFCLGYPSKVVFHMPFLPTVINKSKNRIWYLTMNNYRNAYFRVLSVVKKEYTKVVLKELRKQKVYKKDGPRYTDGQLVLEYVLYPRPNTGRVDVANVCAVVDKFTADGLVKGGVLDDDDSPRVPMVIYRLGEIDPDNPRCELFIHRIKED